MIGHFCDLVLFTMVKMDHEYVSELEFGFTDTPDASCFIVYNLIKCKDVRFVPSPI